MAIVLTNPSYICDICKEKITDHATEMFTYVLPVEKVKIVNSNFHQYNRITPYHKKIDLCEKCNNKLITALEKSYGVIKIFTDSEGIEDIKFEPAENNNN